MENYSNYTNQQLQNYIENTRQNANNFDKEGNYFLATVHHSEAMRALHELADRNSK
jgi:hypothetical protein